MPDVQNTSDYKLSKSGRKIRAHKIVFNKGEEEQQMKTPQVNEVLSKDDPASKWIKDFVHSDNPKFEGKSKKKRINMALGAYYAAQRSGVKEDIDMEVVSIAEMIDRVRETLEEEPSHQARTTMKHIKNPTAGEKKAAKDIKPGIAGYRDRIAMLRSAEAGGRLTKEEVEQIDELKKSTLMRYASKATKSAIGLGVKAARARDEGDMATWAKNRNKAEKRDRNVQKAIGKMRSEEVEQIDELSSSTIDSYRKKLGAKIDTTRTSRPSVQAAIKAKNAPIQAKIHNALMKQHQAIRRERGMSEEVELDEEHLLVAKSELKKHKDWMDSEGYDTKTKPLPVNHPKHKTHVEVKPNSTIEHSYHLDGYAVKEEVEQLDEIGDTPAGKRALRAVQTRAADTMSDPSKSSKQVNKAVGAGVSAGNRLHGFGHDRMKKNTVMGRDALRKQLGVKEEVEGVAEGMEQDDDYSNASFERWKKQNEYEREYDKKKPAKPTVPDNKGKKKGVAEEVELDEAVQVSHDRYMRSHQKMASGRGNWMFTHKRSGDVNYRNDSEVHQANGSFSDAKKSAKLWAQKHGHSTVYVME